MQPKPGTFPKPGTTRGPSAPGAQLCGARWLLPGPTSPHQLRLMRAQRPGTAVPRCEPPSGGSGALPGSSQGEAGPKGPGAAGTAAAGPGQCPEAGSAAGLPEGRQGKAVPGGAAAAGAVRARRGEVS